MQDRLAELGSYPIIPKLAFTLVRKVAPASLLLGAADPDQLVTAGSGWHVWQELFRLASIRDWRAALLADSS